MTLSGMAAAVGLLSLVVPSFPFLRSIGYGGMLSRSAPSCVFGSTLDKYRVAPATLSVR